MHQCRRDILQRPFMILSLVYNLLFIFPGYSQSCPLIRGRNNRTDTYFYISFFAKCLTLQFIQIDRLTSLGIKSHFAANHIAGTFEKKEDGATNSKKTMPTNPARPPTLYFIRCSESTRPLPGRLCKYIAGATPHSTIFAASKLKKECGLSTFNECRQTTHSYSIQQCLSPNHSNTI